MHNALYEHDWNQPRSTIHVALKSQSQTHDSKVGSGSSLLCGSLIFFISVVMACQSINGRGQMKDRLSDHNDAILTWVLVGSKSGHPSVSPNNGSAGVRRSMVDRGPR